MSSIGGRSIIFLLPALLVVLGTPAAAHATLRKCTHAPGSTSLYYPGSAPLLMVDGVVIGDLPAVGTLNGGLSYTTDGRTVTVPTDGIVSIQIICLDHEVGGKKESRQVISVATRDGTEGMLRRYLVELAELQDAYRQSNGAYAAALQYVGFDLTRHPVPIELSVVDGGWAASANTSWSESVCRVAVGAAASEGTQSGKVDCFDKTTLSAGAPISGEIQQNFNSQQIAGVP